MAVDQRGRRFRVRRMVDGQMYTQSFGTYEEAKARDLEIEQAVLRGEKIAPAASLVEKSCDIVTMEDLYDVACKTEWSNKCRIVRDNARRFVDFVGADKFPKAALTPANVDAFTIHRERKLGQSPKTINRYLSSISVLQKVAKRYGLVTEMELPWRKEEKGRITYFTHEQEAEVYRVLRKHGYQKLVELFMVLCDTGGRLEEVRRIRWPEVLEHHVHFVKTKTDLERTVPLTERAKEVLDLKQCRAGHLPGPFFDVGMKSIRIAWKILREEIDWMTDEYVPHTFRHTCCTRLVMGRHGEFFVQRWMGHRSLATTKRYAHFNTSSLDHMTAALASPSRVVANDDQAASAVA